MERSLRNADLNANIHWLNHDCLQHIFMFLPIIDRVNAQLVCREWNYVIQRLWKIFKQLDVNKSKWKSEKFEQSKFLDITIFKSVLQSCGQYLTEVNLTYMCDEQHDFNSLIIPHYDIVFSLYRRCNTYEETFEGINALTLHCNNIEKLSLCSLVINCNEEYLSNLFKNNKKIRFLNLMGYREISGECLSNLSMELVEALLLQECAKISCENICMVLSRFQKLDTLALIGIYELQYSHENVIAVMTLLSESVKYLYVGDLCGDDLMDAPSLVWEDITNLKNLRVLQINSVFGTTIYDLLIAVGSNCKNLRSLDISECADVTDNILTRITTLPKLETLRIDGLSEITDRSLLHLSEHLKELSCRTCKITDVGIAKLLQKSPNIEFLDLSFCINITNDTINNAIDVTICRTDNIVLKINIDMTRIDMRKIKNNSSLLQVLNAPTDNDLQIINSDSYNVDNYDLWPRVCEENFKQKHLYYVIDTCMGINNSQNNR